jgi:AGCS family alanine or glycine:cation symporter
VNLTGGWGAGFVSLIVLLFAFSSIVVNYLYAENNLIFLKLDSRRIGLLLAVMLMVIAGSCSACRWSGSWRISLWR